MTTALHNHALHNHDWQPLKLLRSNLLANLAALATRMPDLAARLRDHAAPAEYFISTSTGAVALAIRQAGQFHLLANPVPPRVAQQTIQQSYPAGHYSTTMMVAGLDQGWLWNALYELPCVVPGLPGHRPPLYFLCRDLERLWLVLHLQRWQKLLADSRVLLFVGADAIAQLREQMLARIIVPWPKYCVNIDASLWPAGMTLESLLADAHRTAGADLVAMRSAIDAAYADLTPAAIAARLRSGRPLRIMGLTSLYTTFLQHSMRDWLDAFERMGHQTKLVIEERDHETLNNVIYSQISRDFRPDLIVMIDHYRAEIGGLPEAVPCVMWVQDNLSNIFSPRAGTAQGGRDFCLGFGRQHLASRHGYPADQFLPATMGINEERFALQEPTADEMARFGCDVSYVSHASATAEQIIADKAATLDGPTMDFLYAALQRMKAHYAADSRLISDVRLKQIIGEAAADTRVAIGPNDLPGFTEFLMQRVNNALVRHETLLWLANMGLDLRLYGKGWDQHPQLAGHARGIADNKADLAAIYRCSRINIQVTPFGCVHQRMLDGLAAGAFFLARWSQYDQIGRIYVEIWDWCRRNDIGSDEQLRSRADDRINALIGQINALHRYDTATYDMPLYDLIRTAADTDFMISASSIWPEYEAIAFATRDELQARVRRYLDDPAARRDLAMRMRQTVIDRCSYRAINQRLLDFVAARFERQAERLAA